ncbi:MAG: hypothetical protein ACXWJ4_02115 [Methyloceanibacter sp.]
MADAATTKVGNIVAYGVKRLGRAFKGHDAANADGGQHGAHHREHRPLVVDDRDHKCIKIATKRAMHHHGTLPLSPATGLLSGSKQKYG